MAYRFNGSTDWVQFAISPINGYTFGPVTFAMFLKFSSTSTQIYAAVETTGSSQTVQVSNTGVNVPRYVTGGSGSNAPGTFSMSNTSTWYLFAITGSGSGAPARYHLHDGSSWTHGDSATSLAANATIGGTDKLYISAPADWGSFYIAADIVCAGIKKGSSTDLAVETLSRTAFSAWAGFGFDWLIGFDSSFVSGGKLQDQASPGTGDEVTRSGTSLVSDPSGWAFAATPAADFTGTPTSGTASLSVAFTDTSTNTPTSWAWTFGDGGTSTSQNPTHSYTSSGVYTVTLVATNSSGSDTKTRTAYITVAETISYATGGGIEIW